MTERKPDATYILSEQQFADSLIRGASQHGPLPPRTLENVERSQIERAQNGGVVLRLWMYQRVTPELLLPLLRTYLPTLLRQPTKKEIESWSEKDLIEVSQWARVEHARASPIAGMALPEPVPLPAILDPPGPIERKPSKPAKKRAQRASLAAAHAAEAKARRAQRQQEEPDPSEKAMGDEQP